MDQRGIAPLIIVAVVVVAAVAVVGVVYIARRSSTIDTTGPTWTQAQLRVAVTVKDSVTNDVLDATTKKTS